MEFDSVQDFAVPLDRLWAACSHADYPRSKYLALGASAVRVQRFDATRHGIEVELERDLPLDEVQVPPWAHPWLGNAMTLRHHTVWRRERGGGITARLEVSALGLPVHAHAAGALSREAPELTRLRLHWRVTSPLPVIGERVEQLFAEQLRDALRADADFTTDYAQRAGRA